MAKKKMHERARRATASPAPRRVAPDPFTAAGPVHTPGERVPRWLVALLCLVLLVVFRLRAADPLGVRTDSWSEANLAVSARNVSLNGWAKYHGVAQHQVDRPPFKEDPFFRYAQYPLGTDYINWLLYDLGATTFSAWRWPPVLLSLTALVLWYALLCCFVGRWAALASSVALGTSWGFLAYGDNVHHAYSNAPLVGMMLCFVAGVAARGRKRLLLLGGSWALLLVNSFLSWEWYFWSQSFYWGYALLIGVPFKKRWLLTFALAPVLAFGIQSHQRAVAFGSQPAGGFEADLLRRTIRLNEATDTPRGVTLANYPLHVAKRFKQFYGIGLLPVCVLALAWAVLLGGLRPPFKHVHPAMRLVVLLFLCSVSWWCVMIQHTAVHPHVMRHALFFYALVIGLTVTAAWRFLFCAGHPAWLRAAGALTGALVLWAHFGRSAEDIKAHSDRAYSDPNHWAAGWSESRRFADLAVRLPGDAILLTNNNRLPLLRYWTNLPVYRATFSRYPFNRQRSLPNSRLRIELTTSHLRDLYDAQMPRLLYVYFFRRRASLAYKYDRILWQLIDGTWTQRPTAARVANFREFITRGKGSTTYPLVARGGSWLCFDASRLLANLPPQFLRAPPPTRADWGPPR